MGKINILFVGDVFGKTGRETLNELLPGILKEYNIDYCIVNGENAAHGRGLSMQCADEIFVAGADCITMGNHTWDNNDIYQFIDDYRVIRPVNFAEGLPGRGCIVLEDGPCPIGVLSVQGRVYMEPCDNPFEAAFNAVMELRKQASVIIVDFHAEATAEKEALACYLDGIVTAIVGTHTHVQTADEKISQQGTAYISDVGMTGPHNGVIGMDKTAVINKFVRCVPQKFKPSEGCGKLHAVYIKADEQTGQAEEIKRISISLQSGK